MQDTIRSVVFSLSVIRGMSALVFTISVPFLNIYLYERGYDMSKIGFISGLSTFLGSTVRVFSGGLADIVSPVKVMFYGVLLRCLSLLLIALLVLTDAHILFFSLPIFLNSAAFSLIINGSNTLLSYAISDSRRRILAISSVRVGINLGFSVGPIIGGFISHYSYFANFILSSLLSVSVLPPTLKIAKSISHTNRKANIISLKEYLSELTTPLGDKRFMWLSLSSLFSAIIFSQFINTLPVFAKHHLIDKRLIGYFFTVNGVAVILFQVWITRVSSRKLGSFGSGLLGIFIYASAFFMFGVHQDFLWLLFSVFYMTIGEMLLIPSLMNTAMKMSPDDKKGVYLGFFEFAEIIGWSFGKYIGGVVFDHFVSKPVYMWGILSSLSVLPFTSLLMTRYKVRS